MPAVHVEQVIADHRTLGAAKAITLPPKTRDVEIDYAGLSFVAPQKMQFRYRLVGLDQSWQSVGTRRTAFYMNLKPGKYRFQVSASNNDGVWNTAGDSIAISILPTFFQTIWFKAIVVLLIVGLLWLGVWLRIRYVTEQMEARLSARQAERIRIARELHDTLLQGFHGLLMRFQVVAAAIPTELAARSMMEAALDRAEDVLVAGRDRVSDLRSMDDGGSSLPQELKRLALGLERDGRVPIKDRCSGTPRPLSPAVQMEILAIASEALTNAYRHAQATSIFWDLTFSTTTVTLVCGDNGVGIDPQTMKAGGREGHWGLTGMHERARQIGGVLKINSAPGQTTVTLILNTRLALFRQLGRRLFLWTPSGSELGSRLPSGTVRRVQ
jgi:signal transduction histidine kinase